MTPAVRTRSAWRWRTISMLVAVVLLVGLVPASVSALVDRDPKRRVLSPVVTNGKGYLNNGYARGARLLTLPGNLVGVSSDGTIAATRSSGGLVKGYRLADGQVAWEVGGDRVADCPAFKNQLGSLWFPERNVNSAVVICHPEGEPLPSTALNLRTGEWADFAVFAQHPEFKYSGLDDRFIYVTTRDKRSGDTRFVSLDFAGREVSSVTVFRAEGELERTKRCWKSEGGIQCTDDAGKSWLFDAATGALKKKLDVEDWHPTSDGYWLYRGGNVRDFYDRSGKWVGSTDKRPWCLTPDLGVVYSNADHMQTPRDCDFSLVGRSGRVFAERTYGDSSLLLTQAGKRVPVRSFEAPWGFISADESVVAILPQDHTTNSMAGALLFDPYTGELIASFPLPWAGVESGIIFWTASDWLPDRQVGTQVLVPGA